MLKRIRLSVHWSMVDSMWFSIRLIRFNIGHQITLPLFCCSDCLRRSTSCDPLAAPRNSLSTPTQRSRLHSNFTWIQAISYMTVIRFCCIIIFVVLFLIIGFIVSLLLHWLIDRSISTTVSMNGRWSTRGSLT
jgi:hypothetical protein